MSFCVKIAPYKNKLFTQIEGAHREKYYMPKIILAFTTAILSWIAWPAHGFAPLLFFVLTPLLLIENIVYQAKTNKIKSRLFPYSYLTFFLFNIFNI